MNFQEILGGPLGQRLAWTLLHFLWQGLLISAGVAAAGWLLSPAQTRGKYAVALAGLVLMACCPLVTFGIVQVSAPKTAARAPAPDLPAEESQLQGPVQMPASDMARGAPPGPPARAGEVAPEPSADPVPQTSPAEPGWRARLAGGAAAVQPYAVAVWLAGVVALAGRLLASVLGVRRLARGRLPVTAELAAIAARLAQRLGLSGAPGVYLSQRVREAMLVGLWRPMVLLPVAWIVEMPLDVLDAVIAHELAHVRRWDLWANLLQRLVETLLFYHPAVWWLSRRASLLREMCADDLAVQATGDRTTYASVLEHLGRRRLKLPTPQLAACIGGRRMALLDRVRNVMGVAPSHERLRWWPAGLLALLAPLGLWLVSLGMAQSQPADEEKAVSPESPSAKPSASSPGVSQPAKTSAKAAKGPVPTIDQISAAWTARQKRVRTARLEWKATEFIAKGTMPPPRGFFGQDTASQPTKREPLPPVDVSLECSQAVFVNGKMMRMDYEGDYWHPARGDLEQHFKVCTTDGEVAKMFFDERTTHELHGFIDKGALNTECDAYSYRPIALAFRPCDRDMGGMAVKNGTIESGLEDVDGRACVVLSFASTTLWLDPLRDFVVVRMRDEQNERTHRTWDISYREDPSHVWVPLEWKMVFILQDKVWGRTVAKVTGCTLNADIPRSVFQFEFPVGTSVSDLRKEDEGNDAIERYIVRPGGKKRVITKEEIRRGAGADYQELLRTESGKARANAAAGQPSRRSDQDSKIAHDIARLDSSSEPERAAALKALISIGKPAGPLLVGALGDPRANVRAHAAEAVRAILAANPASTPNYHDKAFWQQRIAQLKVGMALDEALKLLLPELSPAERQKRDGGSFGSGRGGVSTYQLDDYWAVKLYWVDFGKEKLGQAAPDLIRRVRQVWIAPPEKYTGDWATWYVNGQKAHEIQYRNGKYDGTFTAFNEDGTKCYRQHYTEGVCHGTDTGWHGNGKKSYEGQYVNGKQVGTWRWWDENGKEMSTQEFKPAEPPAAKQGDPVPEVNDPSGKTSAAKPAGRVP
jgi:beta-lactamase regulating signal transducer with metallopeptidase domain